MKEPQLNKHLSTWQTSCKYSSNPMRNLPQWTKPPNQYFVSTLETTAFNSLFQQLERVQPNLKLHCPWIKYIICQICINCEPHVNKYHMSIYVPNILDICSGRHRQRPWIKYSVMWRNFRLNSKMGNFSGKCVPLGGKMLHISEQVVPLVWKKFEPRFLPVEKNGQISCVVPNCICWHNLFSK